jgi:regulator of RNase E activity RraA
MFSPPSQARIHGPAVTVRMVEMSDEAAPRLEKHFVDHNQNDGIMYIQQPKGLPSACWGGLMSTRAKFLGAQGVVIDGRMRDVNEHNEMGFPVSALQSLFVETRLTYPGIFARGTSVLGSNSYTRASQVNVPLQFHGDLWVNPGDILVADADGVVVTPPSLVDQVVELCQQRAEVDKIMFDKLRKGAAMGPLIKNIRGQK